MTAFAVPAAESTMSQSEIEQLEAALRASELTVFVLTRELVRTIEAPTPVAMEVGDGKITVLLSNGAIRQHSAVPSGLVNGEYSSSPSGWTTIAPVPGCAAAIVEEALQQNRAYRGMAVIE